MRRNKASCPAPGSGATLVELLVVMFIVSIMLGLLMPALQHAREAANRTVCSNNFHQFSIGLRQTPKTSGSRKISKAPPGEVGGWAIEVLPYIEQKAASEDFKRRPSLNPGEISSFAFIRPGIMSCPSAYTGKSDNPPIPVTHYVMAINSERDWWTLGDAPLGYTLPWCVSPEVPLNYWTKNKGPHDGGFLSLSSNGGVEFKLWE